MENNLRTLVFKNGHLYTGKLELEASNLLLEAVKQDILIMATGQAMVLGTIIGDIQWESDAISAIFTLEKDSPLWKNYFGVRGNLKIESNINKVHHKHLS